MRDYNFFDGYGKKSSFRFNLSSPIFIFAIVAILLSAASFWMITENNALQEDIKSKYLELTTLHEHEDYEESQRLDQVISILKEYDLKASKNLEDLFAADNIGVDFMNELEGALPATVSTTNLNITNEVFSIVCEAPSREVVATLFDSLLETGLFDQLRIMSVVRLEEGNQFTVNIDGTLKAGDMQ